MMWPWSQRQTSVFVFHRLCCSTRSWWKARCMRRCPQPATLKMTSATLWKTASFTWRTPSTTYESPCAWRSFCPDSPCLQWLLTLGLCRFQTWTPHYFVLTSNKIYYSEETSRYQTTDEEEDDEGKEALEKTWCWWWQRGDAFQFISLFPLAFRSVTTTSSTVRSAGSTGSWVEVAMVDRWPRSSCRNTVRAGAKTARSWCGKARRLSETTRSRSGQ